MSTLALAFDLVARWEVLLAITLAAVFGLFVGAIPGLTATLAVAVLVPITFHLDPIAAVGAMVSCSAMAIFAGDIPAFLLRIPGTPASAAYADEGYKMTLRGEAEKALGASLLFSAVGGLFGTAVLMLAAPSLAEVALKFSSFEYFWLALLGLTSAAFVSAGDPLKGLASLLIGLSASTIGMENPIGTPRFNFGSIELLGGVNFIAALIGLFAVAEILRYALKPSNNPHSVPQTSVGNPFRAWGKMLKTYWRNQIRGNILGVVVGALPGAGADIAAWMAYSISRRFSKQKEKYGTGHVEGIIESTSANNAALGSAWVPALVFGVPGDSITAIVIGVLFVHGMNPGPTLFLINPENIYAVFLIFIVANILLVVLGWGAIAVSKRILIIPRRLLMPVILAFCVTGAFAGNNNTFDIGVMLCFGILGFLMEENGIPVAPCILGLLLGEVLESNFITSMLKADGDLFAFFSRPISAGLGILTLIIWLFPLIRTVQALRVRRQKTA
ncbi:tripartite tricarboxylate transporter permease [Roseibium sp. CAU 1637]|uniref:Tripartite tricarboxylate transporter permease n=1 Tax=Roseibium limicola TaxID=2816037 RepID=A0A939ESY5_9HYPH|nr:tripartite tricarboxylate transporter permease [Roseibium limicola]MBO0347043.1 tripartite tricarboxylate transporter permease [Roseibium limicola]